jgi:hypothetical protein
LEEFRRAPLQLPAFVQRAVSSQQLAVLQWCIKEESSLLLMYEVLCKFEKRLTTLTEQAQWMQEWMAALPTGEGEWIDELHQLRLMLAEQRERKDELTRGISCAEGWMQRLVDAVHTVFALPEVERTTDLLPELIGLIGEFLSIDANPAEYVSIHALPKPSHQIAAAVEGPSGPTSPRPADGFGPSVATSVEESKESSTARMDESE